MEKSFKELTAGVVAAMVLTALLLPGRQTAPVFNAINGLLRGVIRASEGR
jgi:hypothetical protein